MAHVGFSEERVCLHYSEMVGVRERVDMEGELAVNKDQAVAEEKADVGGMFAVS